MIRSNVERHGSGYCVAQYRIDAQGRSIFLHKMKDELGNVRVFHTEESAESWLDTLPKEAFEVARKFIVMRSPVLMEDEGRHFFEAGPFDTLEDAKAKITELTPPGSFFHKGDYYVAEGND